MAKRKVIENTSERGLPDPKAAAQLKKLLTAPGTETKKTTKSSGINKPEVLSSAKTGRQAGITIPGETKGQRYFGPQGELTKEEYIAMGGTAGRTFLGLSPKEVASVAAGEAAKTTAPPGAITAAEGAELRKQELLKQQLAEQIGAPIGEITGEAPELSQEQALKSALTAAGAGVAGGAAVGAAGGAAFGGIGAIPGAIGGAIVGGVGTFLTAYRGNLKSQVSGELAASKTGINKAISTLGRQITLANTDPGGVGDYSLIFNQQMELIRQEYYDLQALQYEDKLKWLGEDTTRQMAIYEQFFSAGGMGETLQAQMRNAILNPDPNRAIQGISLAEDFGETE